MAAKCLTVSPRELIFRFDDQTDLDPLTIADGISITRAGADGGFESATATTDMGTGGTVLVEFRARRQRSPRQRDRSSSDAAATVEPVRKWSSVSGQRGRPDRRTRLEQQSGTPIGGP